MNEKLFRGELVRLTAQNPEADAETFAKWSRDSEYLRLAFGNTQLPRSAQQARTDMERRTGETNPHHYGLAIRTLADDTLIGFIGLMGVSGTHGDAWVYIAIGDRAYWGKGYGTDAMRVLLHYAFTELNLHRVSLGVFEYNPRAIRSYEKVGFVVEGHSREELHRDGKYWDDILMGILREDWKKENV